MTDPYVDIRCGDAIEVMAGMAADSVDCCVTSPPYWNLRKYDGEQERVWADGSKAAFGLEPTPEMYLSHTIEVLRAIRRVLKPTGVVWWNIDDSYWGGKGQSAQAWSTEHTDRKTLQKSYHQMEMGKGDTRPQDGKHPIIKPLDLCLIPEQVALAARQDGWYVRSIVVWAKPNPMPESVAGWRWERCRGKVGETTVRMMQNSNRGSYDVISGGKGHLPEWQDCPGCPKCAPNDGYVLRKGSWRPTDAYEQILMLAKSHEYYSDGEEVREAYTEPMNRWGGDTLKRDTSKTTGYKEMQNIGYSSAFRVGRPMRPNENGRNLRNVWTFPTTSFKGAHFAVYPERLPEICILSSTPSGGVCSKCGKPWAREKRSEIGYNDIYEDMHKMQTTPAVDRISSRKTFEGWPKNEVPNMRSGRSQNPLSKSEGDKSSLRQDLQREASRSNQGQEGSISEERNRQNEYVSSEQAISANGEGESKCQRKEPPLFADNAGQDNESSPLQPTPRTSFRSTREFQPDRLAGSIAESETPLLLLLQKVHTEETSNIRPRNTSKQRRQARQNQYSSCLPSMQQPKAQSASNARIGFRPTCTCKSPSEPALVLDCFSGAGTTGVVAKRLGRKAILIDISPNYCEMARKRVEATAAPMRLEC